MLIRGWSCIVDPFGELLAGPVHGRERLLVANLDLDQVVRSSLDLDVRGHYAHSEIFRLTVHDDGEG